MNRPITSGRYSKNLARLRKFYEDSLADPSLMDLREPIAMLDSIVKRLAQMSDEADTPKFRERCLVLMERAVKAQRDGDADEAATALNKLHALLRAGAKDAEILRTLARETERLARRVEAAWNVKLSAQSAINARDLVVVLGEWAAIVQQVAPGHIALQILAAIDARLRVAKLASDGRFEKAEPLALDAPSTNGHDAHAEDELTADGDAEETDLD